MAAETKERMAVNNLKAKKGRTSSGSLREIERRLWGIST